jgi:hypothetical protein
MAFLEPSLGLSPDEGTKSRLPSFSPSRRHFFALLLGALSLIAAAAQEPARAQSDTTREYQIKAAFLFNFAQFVKWPGQSFVGPGAPFKIGVLGDDPFGSALDETIRGESINGHRLTVLRSQTIEDLKDCQLVFVSRSEENHLGEILAQLDARPVLTVSEIESFARDGGDIDFYLTDGKIRFEINPQAARRCGLKISSQLLTLGRIIEP